MARAGSLSGRIVRYAWPMQGDVASFLNTGDTETAEVAGTYVPLQSQPAPPQVTAQTYLPQHTQARPPQVTTWTPRQQQAELQTRLEDLKQINFLTVQHRTEEQTKNPEAEENHHQSHPQAEAPKKTVALALGPTHQTPVR